MDDATRQNPIVPNGTHAWTCRPVVLPSDALDVPAVAQGWTQPKGHEDKRRLETETLRPPPEEGRGSESDVTHSLSHARPPARITLCPT